MKNIHKELLGFTEVGGIGEISYRSIRFPEYDIRGLPEKDEDGNWVMEDEDYSGPVLLCPRYKEDDKMISPRRDHRLTGQNLLTSLCNLYQELNDPKCDIEPTYLIKDWCLENIHPYNMDFIYEQYTEDLSYEVNNHIVERDGVFAVEDFLKDLEPIYHTTCFYHALTQLIQGERSYALALYSEGRLSDSYPFFEKYKSRPTQGGFLHFDDIMEEMEHKKQLRAPEADIPPEKRTFMQNPLKDLDYLHEALMSLFPEFRMKLRKDPDTKRITFAADIRSVFDICWYTLARMVADDTPKEDEDISSYFRESSILCCLNCGSFFTRTGPRQKYCKDKDCQAARQRNNQRANRTRKKIQEQQKD